VLPIIILSIFYKNIPQNIPAFVDLWGNTIVSMEKSYISILRLPVMGILLSIICIIMYLINLPNEKRKINKKIWSIIAFIGSLKMGLTSLEILFYENMDIINYFRIFIFILVISGIIILLYGLLKLYRKKIIFLEYKNGINKNKIIIILLLILYILIVIMPVYYKML
jgi:hypothetical protein